jgi:hypothetical protein
MRHACHPGIHPQLHPPAAAGPRRAQLAPAEEGAGQVPRLLRLHHRRPARWRADPAVPAPLRRLGPLLRFRDLLTRPRPLRRRRPAHRTPHRQPARSTRHRLHFSPRSARVPTRILAPDGLTVSPTKPGSRPSALRSLHVPQSVYNRCSKRVGRHADCTVPNLDSSQSRGSSTRCGRTPPGATFPVR